MGTEGRDLPSSLQTSTCRFVGICTRQTFCILKEALETRTMSNLTSFPRNSIHPNRWPVVAQHIGKCHGKFIFFIVFKALKKKAILKGDANKHGVALSPWLPSPYCVELNVTHWVVFKSPKLRAGRDFQHHIQTPKHYLNLIVLFWSKVGFQGGLGVPESPCSFFFSPMYNDRWVFFSLFKKWWNKKNA